MIVAIKSGGHQYKTKSAELIDNVLHAKIEIGKGSNYQKNVAAFYEIREQPSVCVIDGVEHDVMIISYNSIVDYKEKQIIDITIALA